MFFLYSTPEILDQFSICNNKEDFYIYSRYIPVCSDMIIKKSLYIMIISLKMSYQGKELHYYVGKNERLSD
jgi:hypothetical protein